MSAACLRWSLLPTPMTMMTTTRTKTGNTTNTTRMTRTKTRMRRKSKSGLVVLLPALYLAQILFPQAGAQGTKKKAQKEAEPYAVIAGTVFRDPGFAQPGASVVLALKSAPGKKLLEVTSSPRGEFTFRVPAEPNT